ncbi:prephenate dehydratase [Pirellulaceae bacterium SH449]
MGIEVEKRNANLTASKSELSKRLKEIDGAICSLVEKRSALLCSFQDSVGNLAEHTAASLRGVQTMGTASHSTSDRSKSEILDRVVAYIAGVTHQSVITETKVAYLGPEFSYSYSAARKFFGAEHLQAVQTIGAVFEEIERAHANFGVVPIENSTDGRIVDTLTMFVRKSVHICGEVYLPIHHNLLAMCSRAEIKDVYSKPQALSQCRAWLAEHLPGVKWIEVASTAVAAQIAATTPHAAAVASKDAGIALGLDLIAPDIEDNPDNVTRFAVISNQDALPTGRDKTSLMFQVPHKPGALADSMLIFRDRGLNLTWIESYPIPGSLNEYFFFVELDGHRTQDSVQDAITELQKMSLRVSVLGSYPKGTR